MTSTRKRHKTPTTATDNKDRENEAKQLVLNKCCLELHEATVENGGRKPYGMVADMVNDLKASCPWISRHTINFAYEKFIASKEDELEDVKVPDTPVTQNVGGRPVGSTKEAKLELKTRLRECLNACASEFHEQKNVAKRDGKYLKRGCLEEIIRKQKEIFELSENIKIDKELIRARHYRGHLTVNSMGPVSPMAAVEPQLVELIIRMSRIRRCLTPTQCLLLANDLVEGTKHQDEIIAFKEKRYRRKFEKASLGQNYWKGFKKRWEHTLTFKRGQKFALDRSAALTFSNMNKMYNEVYEAMTECKVASKRNHPVYETVDGSPASDWNEKFGIPCSHKIEHPEMCLVVDEVGSDLSQKGDGHIGGAKYACEKGSVPQNKVQHTDKHFTLLGFTALSGEPVLCLVIIAGVQESLAVESGIDPFVTETHGDASDKDYFDRNFDPGKLFPGGPTCKFLGHDIPCMVRWSPKGSITSQILADALKHIDSFNVFERKDGKFPFLLLDGHQSRFELPFLEYITEKSHEWQVCIGVPYGTSLWQVADSKEQNGSYKISLAKSKKDFLEKKLSKFIDPPSLSSTDIIPLVNVAWSASFARISKNKKAIAERGWGPCNRNLLLYKEIQNTMTREDIVTFDAMKKNYVQPDSDFVSPIIDSLCIKKPNSDTTIISDLTDPHNNKNTSVISLNYSSGNSAMVLETLIGAQDLNEARERNKRHKTMGIEASNTYKKAKAVTAMYHFKEYGCKIGKTALEKKREIQEIQKMKILEARKKEEKVYNEKKRKYDEVISLNLSDEKLTIGHLRSLLNMKKRKTDKSISGLKKKEMLVLWKEWKARPLEPLLFDHDIVYSVNEVSHDTTITDNDAIETIEAVETMASV